MAKKKIFISYDYDNDKNYKNLLKAWDANGTFDFSFHDPLCQGSCHLLENSLTV